MPKMQPEISTEVKLLYIDSAGGLVEYPCNNVRVEFTTTYGWSVYCQNHHSMDTMIVSQKYDRFALTVDGIIVHSNINKGMPHD